MNLTHHIPKPAAFVFDYLSDMQKFVSVHPVIYRIDSLGKNEYLVYESLKVGFIPYSFTYPVQITSDPIKRTVLMKATVRKIVHIEMYYAIREDGMACVVDEEIKIRSFLPVKSSLERMFRKYHEEMFLNIGLASD